ncbi:RFC5 [Symbiodinium natans]|uniref:RFC5 protein n=1 Tax=Symbiodinium natans TaxID=878477 RepID=A0A812MPH4_9DINO|nr:RFC5 [Symbiodinium natans]
MGKSIRSKIKKRLRTVKRQRVDAMLVTPREEEKHQKLIKVAQGKQLTLLRPKNAFKYPESDDAVFPQHEVMKPVDFRAQNLPMAGTVFRGNRRKYTNEEKDMLTKIIKENHPKMEVLAGGGAVLAKSGRRVSQAEAERLATKIRRPDVAEAVEAEAADPGPPASEESPMQDAPPADIVPDPADGIDTSRRPVLKDTRRAKRAAGHRKIVLAIVRIRWCVASVNILLQSAATVRYKCPFRKAWVDVSDAEDRQLKEAFAALARGGAPVAQCKLGSLRFQTDFRTMLRTNVASKRRMEVRLRDGALPFAPPAGEDAPSRASLGLEEEAPEKIAPCDLESGPGRKVPHLVRQAWGQGIEDGVTMSGQFEFTMQASEKDCFGEMLAWQMHAAGIAPQSLDNRCLKFTDAKGTEAMGNKQEIGKLLANPGSYPVRVSYFPHPAFKFVRPERVPDIEVTRTHLKFVQDALAELDGNIDNVKHTHQRRTFERYLLYLEDHYYQTGDDLQDALEWEPLVQKYGPHMEGYFLLTKKTGPGLSKILRGEIDVLEYLFGG